MAPVHRGDCIVVEKWVTNTGEKVTVCRDLSYRRRRLGAAGFHQRSYYKFVIRDSADRVSPRFRTASVRLRRVVYFLSLFFFRGLEPRVVRACQIPRPNAANLSMFRVVSRSGNERLFRQLGILFSLTRSLMHPISFPRTSALRVDRPNVKKKKNDGTLKRRETSLFFKITMDDFTCIGSISNNGWIDR